MVGGREVEVADRGAGAAAASPRPPGPAEPREVVVQAPGRDAVHAQQEAREARAQGVHAGEARVRLVTGVVGKVLRVDAESAPCSRVGPVGVGGEDRAVGQAPPGRLPDPCLGGAPAAADLGEHVAERVLCVLSR